MNSRVPGLLQQSCGNSEDARTAGGPDKQLSVHFADHVRIVHVFQTKYERDGLIHLEELLPPPKAARLVHVSSFAFTKNDCTELFTPECTDDCVELLKRTTTAVHLLALEGTHRLGINFGF